MTWDELFRIGHVLGTALGVGGATMAEVFMFRAAKSGPPDPAVGNYLRLTYRILRIGLVLLVLSGFAFLLHNRLLGFESRLYSPRLWAKLALTAIILFNAILMQVKKMPLLAGSAISITSWYAAMVLGIWRVHSTFVTIMLYYLAAVAVVAIALKLLHSSKKGGSVAP